MKRSLKKEWEEYEHIVLGVMNLSADAIREIRHAFYAGAIGVMRAMRNMPSPDDMNDLFAELNEFANNILKERE